MAAAGSVAAIATACAAPDAAVFAVVIVARISMAATAVTAFAAVDRHRHLLIRLSTISDAGHNNNIDNNYYYDFTPSIIFL